MKSSLEQEFKASRVIYGGLLYGVLIFGVPILSVGVHPPLELSVEKWLAVLLGTQFSLTMIVIFIAARSMKFVSQGEVIGHAIINNIVKVPHPKNPELMVVAYRPKEKLRWLALVPATAMLSIFSCFLTVKLSPLSGDLWMVFLALLFIAASIPTCVDAYILAKAQDNVKRENQECMKGYEVQRLIALTTSVPEIRIPALRELKRRGPINPDDKVFLKNPGALQSEPLPVKEFLQIELSMLQILFQRRNLVRWGKVSLLCFSLILIVWFQSLLLESNNRQPYIPITIILLVIATLLNWMFVYAEHESIRNRFRKRLIESSESELDSFKQLVGVQGKLEIEKEIKRRSLKV